MGLNKKTYNNKMGSNIKIDISQVQPLQGCLYNLLVTTGFTGGYSFFNPFGV